MKIDVSAYFVVGPENLPKGDMVEVIKDVMGAGFTAIQIRSKILSPRELVDLGGRITGSISGMPERKNVKILINDRLDVCLECLERGYDIDGIHVGQDDVSTEVCRKYLGREKVVGLSLPTHIEEDYLRKLDLNTVDYFGWGPIRPTDTKTDCGMDENGNVISKTYEDIKKLKEISPIPIVIGGGIRREDLTELKKTGVDGFFTVSAIALAKDPKEAARNLYRQWKEWRE